MKFILFVVMFCFVLAVTCERATKVSLENGNPPTFVLVGSGRLTTLIIYGSKQRDIAGDRAYVVWQIVPTNGRADARPVEELSKIKYGVVPKGYKQKYPDQGAPPVLLEGQKYEYWFQTLNASHARGYFEIRNGKAAPLSQ